MKKILLATALIMASSFTTAAVEKGPWELVGIQKVYYLHICHYQRAETVDTITLVNNAYTVGYGRCIAPSF